MSQINLKSITGITSITTPGGVDDVFTVHSNDTTERFRVDSNGNQVIAGILTVTQDLNVDGHINLDNVSIVGVTTLSNTGANQLVIKDSDTSGDAAHMRISFQDSGGTEKFFVGNNNSNGWLYLGSPSGQNNNIAFRVNGSDKFQVNASGAYVNGALTVTGNADISDSIIHTGDTDTKIRFHDADKFKIELGGVTSAFSGLKSTSGAAHARWGINVATPGAVLHIDEVYNHQGLLRVTNGNQNSGYYHQLEMSGTNNIFTLWRHYDGSSMKNTHAHGSTAHVWYIGGNEQVRIDSSGNILTQGNTQLFGSNTSDGSDNKAIMINGGGAVSDSRGGYLLVHGNEHSSNPGITRLHAGNVGTAYLTLNTGGNERLRITSTGEVNIGGNFTQTTYTAQVTSGSVNKKIGFGAAAHNDLSNEGSGIFFSRQSDGADGLSGIFAHTNDHLGLATRGGMTFHAGGSSTYGSAPQRMLLDTSGRLYLGSNFTGGNGDVDDLVISGTGNKGITVCSTDGGNVRITFADGLSSTAAVIGSIVYEHSVDAMDFYTNALRMMRVDRANSTERLQIGSTNNSSSGTRLVLGSGNNIAATAVINTQDTNINALTLSNWDGSTTTNKVNMHFDCSGIAGFDVGIPAQTPDFKISNTSGGGGYINMKSTGETKIYRSGVMLADINNSVQGHQFISQSNDNEDGFQVYNQHGSTTSRYTFACYDNRSGSKGRSFGVRGDGKSIFYGDVLPSADIAYDLGSDSYTWEKFYYKNAYPEQSTEYRITSGSYSNGQWHDTAFGRDNMGGLDLNGIYIVTCFADLYNAMGGNYQCNYTWIVGMRNQYTNQTLVNTCPLLSVTGHSTNNFGASGATVGDGIRLGTSRTPATSGGEEQIVWRPAASTSAINNTAGRTLVFRCQRIGRSSLG